MWELGSGLHTPDRPSEATTGGRGEGLREAGRLGSASTRLAGQVLPPVVKGRASTHVRTESWGVEAGAGWRWRHLRSEGGAWAGMREMWPAWYMGGREQARM